MIPEFPATVQDLLDLSGMSISCALLSFVDYSLDVISSRYQSSVNRSWTQYLWLSRCPNHESSEGCWCGSSKAELIFPPYFSGTQYSFRIFTVNTVPCIIYLNISRDVVIPSDNRHISHRVAHVAPFTTFIPTVIYVNMGVKGLWPVCTFNPPF